ncbi:MAG: tetratricopeptide repeat protein [Gemmatimonadetes bacterium]|nr:tetratricopeptide repeat protein [Gemmatimonadota bacterium]
MKKFLLVAALLFFAADLAYGQTCDAFLNGAKARASSEKWKEANAVLGENLEGCMGHAEYRYMYGITLAQVAPGDSAGKAIRQVQAADSLNAGADEELQENIDQAMLAMWGPLVNDGIRMLAAGQIEEAQAKLETAAELRPDGKEAHLGLGAVHQARNDHDAAIAEYQKALEIDPAYKLALLRLGQVYQLKASELAASDDPAEADRATEVAAEAVEVYQDYLADNPADMDVKIQLAGLHATLGNQAEAEPIIREVMESDSADANVLTELGFQMANSQQNELAEQLLERAVVLSDSNWNEPLNYLAFVQIRQGKLEEAERTLKAQLELDPSNPEAWEYLGYVLRDLERPEEAQTAFERGQAIPLQLQNIQMTQDPDETWNVEAVFQNRTEEPVQGVTVVFHLVSPAGEVLESKEAAFAAGQPLAAGQTGSVRVEFDTQAETPRVRYEIL